MPGRNVIKKLGANEYYHVYSRGVNKQPIFLDEQDYHVFLNLLGRYLSNKPSKNGGGMPYPWYQKRIEILAYCLMPNHIHLLVYQHDAQALPEFMKSLMTSYSMYFNKRYKRVGPVFQSRYRARGISDDIYLDHISRYIHLNPKDWQNYPYSSLRYYITNQSSEWLRPEKIVELFPNQAQYLEFIKDYEGYKDMLDEIKWELANEA